MNSRHLRRAQRAPASGNVLTEHDAAIVKGMLARGDRQHDVAAFFGVNGGRIAEIATGEKFPDVLPMDNSQLPQPFDWRLNRVIIAGIGSFPALDVLPQLVQLRDRLNSIILDLENSAN